MLLNIYLLFKRYIISVELKSSLAGLHFVVLNSSWSQYYFGYEFMIMTFMNIDQVLPINIYSAYELNHIMPQKSIIIFTSDSNNNNKVSSVAPKSLWTVYWPSLCTYSIWKKLKLGLSSIHLPVTVRVGTWSISLIACAMCQDVGLMDKVLSLYLL